ncbi:MAG: hypothetical protein HGN29_03495 [Asgard group archaeon]|nr:hypothetical protein [Asgard group archaeon]
MSQSKNRRTLIERAKAIFQKIEYEYEPFPKSRLQDIGFNPSTAEKWLELITYIQKMPRIRLIKTKNTTIIERTERGFHVMSRETFMDPNKSYEERFYALQDYLNALINLEKLTE